MKLEIEIKMSYNDIRFSVKSIIIFFEQEYHHNMITFSFYRALLIFKLRKDAQMCHNMSLHFPDSMARIVA